MNFAWATKYEIKIEEAMIKEKISFKEDFFSYLVLDLVFSCPTPEIYAKELEEILTYMPAITRLLRSEINLTNEELFLALIKFTCTIRDITIIDCCTLKNKELLGRMAKIWRNEKLPIGHPRLYHILIPWYFSGTDLFLSLNPSSDLAQAKSLNQFITSRLRAISEVDDSKNPGPLATLWKCMQKMSEQTPLINIKAFLKAVVQLKRIMTDISLETIMDDLLIAAENGPATALELELQFPLIKKILPNITSSALRIFVQQAQYGGLKNLPALFEWKNIICEYLDLNIETFTTIVCLLKGDNTLLSSFFTYIKIIKQFRPNIDIEKIVNPILHSPTGAFNVMKIFSAAHTKMKSLAIDVRDDWIMTIVSEKGGEKKLENMFNAISQNKKDYPELNPNDWLGIATFETEGLRGLRLLKKLALSTFEEGGVNGGKLAEMLQVNPFTLKLFTALDLFRSLQLQSLGAVEIEDEENLLKEFGRYLHEAKAVPPMLEDNTPDAIFTESSQVPALATNDDDINLWPTQSLNTASDIFFWRRALELLTWGPATGLSIEARAAFFNKYLNNAKSKNVYFALPFSNAEKNKGKPNAVVLQQIKGNSKLDTIKSWLVPGTQAIRLAWDIGKAVWPIVVKTQVGNAIAGAPGAAAGAVVGVAQAITEATNKAN